ncbi:hypothetical protein PUMCH_003360 [Australozyma saopauloensis]|uniref:Uncharacterized protein n=1 Tax=Australozyma saopauloensis TaxID=291208 RepID=A0AAX4HCD0_9ASCO|nr:hypothetical protein PUMCH_003360 [[Candida] saopauloensis]
MLAAFLTFFGSHVYETGTFPRKSNNSLAADNRDPVRFRGPWYALGLSIHWPSNLSGSTERFQLQPKSMFSRLWTGSRYIFGAIICFIAVQPHGYLSSSGIHSLGRHVWISDSRQAHTKRRYLATKSSQVLGNNLLAPYTAPSADALLEPNTQLDMVCVRT